MPKTLLAVVFRVRRARAHEIEHAGVHRLVRGVVAGTKAKRRHEPGVPTELFQNVLDGLALVNTLREELHSVLFAGDGDGDVHVGDGFLKLVLQRDGLDSTPLRVCLPELPRGGDLRLPPRAPPRAPRVLVKNGRNLRGVGPSRPLLRHAGEHVLPFVLRLLHLSVCDQAAGPAPAHANIVAARCGSANRVSAARHPALEHVAPTHHHARVCHEPQRRGRV
mmetsp:Transcript_8602/g.24571  ORF Transcript_8602/g.24571 Transcript_8602/m.24571 type:complete len:221 (+) Transcript_8602:409-1071(+)